MFTVNIPKGKRVGTFFCMIPVNQYRETPPSIEPIATKSKFIKNIIKLCRVKIVEIRELDIF